MLEQYVKQTTFSSYEDFAQNYKIDVPDHFNFGYDIVDGWAAKEPARKALCWVNDKGESHDFTFADVKRHSDAAASFFQSLGIGKGDKVMLILKRRYEFWFSIVALHKLGAICIPATHLLTTKDIVYRNQAAGIKAVVAVGEEDVLRHVEGALDKSDELQSLISVGPVQREGWHDFHKGVSEAAPFVRPREANESEDLMLLYFTSGTTGNPKMVAHTFTYPLAHITTAKYWHDIDPDDLHFTLADTGWGKAVWGKLYGQWIVGANVFVYDFDKFTPVDVLEMTAKYGISSFCAPPTIFRFLIKEDVSKYNITTLKRGSIAGEALNPKVFDDFKAMTNIELKEGFGQTETVVLLATWPWIKPKPGSMGIPNPLFDVDLITPEGRSCEAGEQGEIVVRLGGKRPIGLFHGYYRDEEKTHYAFRGGLYHTGDVAWRDEDGYFWFVGRDDDVIKSSGYRIGPFEVESALMTHPAVLECAITGEPDEVRGQVIKATIVLAEVYKEKAGPELIKEIQTHVKETTAPYKYPRIVEFVEELPKTISGKIKRVDIRKGEHK